MSLILNINQTLTDDTFMRICRSNPDYQFERSKEGKLIIMDLTNSEAGNYNLEVSIEVGVWNRQNQTGKVFDSSTGFTLPNTAIKAPDVSWIRLEKWLALSVEERRKFAHITPDFVIELRSSEDDSLKDLKAKMDEYIENGVQLGWLLDRIQGKAYVYRPNRETRIFDNFEHDVLSGEDVLEGFELKLSMLL